MQEERELQLQRGLGGRAPAASPKSPKGDALLIGEGTAKAAMASCGFEKRGPWRQCFSVYSTFF